MAEATQTFQFTLGPVQGFVAQARRTRDFWAGSFILSWLSSVAIASIQKQGGTVEFPVPDAAYLRHLYQAQEILSYRLNTIHNLAFFLTVVTGARKAIEDGTFQAYKARFEGIYDT